MRNLVVLLLLAPAFAGCLGNEGDDGEVGGDGSPTGDGASSVITAPPGGFTAFGPQVVAPALGDGQGIWIHDGILYYTSGADFQTFDVSDPSNPVLLFTEEGIGARDVDILEWQGTPYAVLSGFSAGIHVFDVTDPANPIFMSTATLPSGGSHNLAVVPGTPYVYNSGASGDRTISVLDLTDPGNPTNHTFAIPQVMGTRVIESDGCHDITVRVDLDRAYCAGAGSTYYGGGGESFIWDITDPLEPIWLVAIDEPRIKYHHQAFVNDDGTILILDDEYVGAYVDGQTSANNCLDAEQTQEAAESGFPVGAAWIYDISDEMNPVQMSYIQNDWGWEGEGAPPNPAEGNCGSHFGTPVDGQDAFIMGWYQGGTLLIDYSDPANPFILDRLEAYETETWEARFVDGYVYHSSGELLITPLE